MVTEVTNMDYSKNPIVLPLHRNKNTIKKPCIVKTLFTSNSFFAKKKGNSSD